MKNDPIDWRVGEILLQNGWVTWEHLEEALKIKRAASHPNLPLDTSRLSGVMGSGRKKLNSVLNLGEILVRNGWIGWEQLKEALQMQQASGQMLGKIFLENGLVSEKDLQRALAIQFDMPFVDFDKVKILPEMTELLPKAIAYEHCVFPLVRNGSSLLIAVTDPQGGAAQVAVQAAMPECEVLVALSLRKDVEKAIQEFYGPL